MKIQVNIILNKNFNMKNWVCGEKNTVATIHATFNGATFLSATIFNGARSTNFDASDFHEHHIDPQLVLSAAPCEEDETLIPDDISDTSQNIPNRESGTPWSDMKLVERVFHLTLSSPSNSQCTPLSTGQVDSSTAASFSSQRDQEATYTHVAITEATNIGDNTGVIRSGGDKSRTGTRTVTTNSSTPGSDESRPAKLTAISLIWRKKTVMDFAIISQEITKLFPLCRIDVLFENGKLHANSFVDLHLERFSWTSGFVRDCRKLDQKKSEFEYRNTITLTEKVSKRAKSMYIFRLRKSPIYSLASMLPWTVDKHTYVSECRLLTMPLRLGFL